MVQEELNKKVDSFVKKYEGKTKGYPNDNTYQGECLSIVKLYIQEVFGFNAPPSGSNSAYGYWQNFPSPLNNYFIKVPNTPQGVPTKGCIPVWNTSMGGGYGHIDIFLEGDVNVFTGFDQNWGGRHAHKVLHDYNNIVGWLAPIIKENQEDALLKDWDRAITNLKAYRQVRIDDDGNPQPEGNWEGYVNSIIGNDRDIKSLRKTYEVTKSALTECENKPPIIIKQTFKKQISSWLYELALQIEGVK